MNEQELLNFRGVGDHLIANAVSHVPDEIFCLVVPTEGANYGLSDSHSLQIVCDAPKPGCPLTTR